MNSIFDENGRPTQEVNDLSAQIVKLANNYFTSMIGKYPAGDIRGVASYLIDGISCSAIQAVLQAQWHNQKEKIKELKNANHFPTEEEEQLLLIDAGRTKIKVIKMVRERTGLGLKESKELVEQWIRNI